MKINRITALCFIIGMFFGFVSCIKEVEFNGEETSPMIVLNSVVADGDTMVYVDITRSLFFLRYGDFANITDAEVTVTCNGTDYSMTLLNDSVYVLHHNFGAGDIVSISAIVPEFGTLTTETAVVPDKPNFGRVYYNSMEDKSFTLEIVNNNPNNTYYQISVCKNNDDTIMYRDRKTNGYEYISCYDSRILLTNTDFPSVNEGTFLLFPARNFGGDTCKLTIDLENTQKQDGQLYYVELASISESLYKYLSTLNNYYSTRGNPFSEPVQVFNNIRGGLGIFGTKSTIKKRIYDNPYNQ